MTRARIAIALAMGASLALPAVAGAGLGDLQAVSVRADGGGTGNFESFAGSGSSDGNVIAFRSKANNLVAGVTDNNGDFDIFIRNPATGANTLVTHAAGDANAAADQGSFGSPVVSGDGKWVAYSSTASDLVPGGPSSGDEHIYLYDVQARTNRLVDHAFGSTAAGDAPAGQVWAVSNDGNFVVYTSPAQDLEGPAATGGTGPQVFRYDAEQDANRLISHSSAGIHTASNGSSVTNVAASANAQAITFTSDATDIASGTTAPRTNVFLWRAIGPTELVSHRANDTTTQQDRDSLGMALSADGKFLLYESDASDVVVGQQAATPVGTVPDIFLYSVDDTDSEMVSHASGNTVKETDNAEPDGTLSSDGRYAAWSSPSSGVTGAGSPGIEKVYLYDRLSLAKTNRLVSHSRDGDDTAPTSASTMARVSPDGTTVAYASTADDLVAGQPVTSTNNVFAWSAASGANLLVSHSSGSTTVPGNGSSTSPNLAGSLLLFDSLASDLAGTADLNGLNDVFVANGPPPVVAGNPTTTPVVTPTTPQQTTGNPQAPPTVKELLAKLVTKPAGPCKTKTLTDVALVICGGNKKRQPNLNVYVVNARATALKVRIAGVEQKVGYASKTLTAPASAAGTAMLKTPAKLKKALVKKLKKHKTVRRRITVTMTGTGVPKTSLLYAVTTRRK